MKAKIRIIIETEYPRDFPEDWGKSDIEFFFNESSSCCDNIITELETISKNEGCLCNCTNVEVLELLKETI